MSEMHNAFHCQECGLYPILPDAIRRLHWPSSDRDDSCDCYDGLQPCPTILALDAVLVELGLDGGGSVAAGDGITDDTAAIQAGARLRAGMSKVEPYWANWSAENRRECNCGHLRGDHSAHDPGACLQRLCVCDMFSANTDGDGHE